MLNECMNALHKCTCNLGDSCVKEMLVDPSDKITSTQSSPYSIQPIAGPHLHTTKRRIQILNEKQLLSLMAVAGLAQSQDSSSEWAASLDSLCKQMSGMVSDSFVVTHFTASYVFDVEPLISSQMSNSSLVVQLQRPVAYRRLVTVTHLVFWEMYVQRTCLRCE